MQFPNGYTDLPPGKLAAVVTYLEMLEPPFLREVSGPWKLRQEKTPDLAWYRDLFRRVGEPYLWMSRLSMSDSELARIIHDANVDVFTLEVDGSDEGILELDFRE